MHAWGVRNRVIFDAGKEHFNVIHTRNGEGDSFKLLGCVTDCKLEMRMQIDHVLNKACAGIVAMLRTRDKSDCKGCVGCVRL